MIARALIVVLAVLNLGVAAWWLLRAEPAPPAAPLPPAGVPVLEIVHTHAAPAYAAVADPAPVPVPAPAAPAAPEPSPEAVCLRAGPFRSRDEAAGLQQRLGNLLRETSLEQEAGAAGMYRVLLPAAGSREAAQESVRRLQAAGFDDVLVLNQGADANAVALGSFRNQDAARRRVDALREAGFPAELHPAGQAQPARWWLRLVTDRAAEVRARAGVVGMVACNGGSPAG